MKIAYLITASGDYNHLQRLVSALDDEHVRFFIHIDAKSPMPQTLGDFPNVTFVPRIKVRWAGWSQVAATLILMREAAKTGFDYYVFLSGGDYPVRPNSFLYETLAGGGEFINMLKGFCSHKPEKRVRYYYFDCFDRRKKGLKRILFLGAERLSRLFARKRRYPFESIWHGSSWWALSEGCVRYILDFVDSHPDYAAFYKTSVSPDESFFQTIIGNSPYLARVRGNLTYTDWSAELSGPAVITAGHLARLRSGEMLPATEYYPAHLPFFARKFNDRSEEVVREIDATRR